jgi:hypothetical protein
MRLLFITVCLLLAGVFFALPVSAAERRMQQNYTIHVTVECLETAIGILRDLPGFNLSSNFTNVEPHMGWPVRQAHYTRRVENWAFRHMQAVLRDLGEVTMENEHAWHLGGEFSMLETRIKVLTEEINRLSILMAASTSLHVLIAIDNQLSRVSWERDNMIGRRNRIVTESTSTMVHIFLSEKTEFVRPEDPGFGQRIVDSFMGTWNGLLRTGGNLTVFVVRISIPLAIWLTVGGLVSGLLYMTLKRKKRKPEAVTPTPVEGAIVNEKE